MEEETKELTEIYSAKCVDYDALQSELCDVKVELQQALQEVEAYGKVREEAKEQQVRCSVLEEQIQVCPEEFWGPGENFFSGVFAGAWF